MKPASVGDLAAEVVALAKFLTDDLDDVIRVAVGFGEYQRLGQFFAAGKDFGPLVTERANDGADLIWHHDGPVKLGRRKGFVLILLFPTALAGRALTFLDHLLGPNRSALLGDLSFDDIDLVTDIDLIGHCLFVVIFADHVLAEEAKGAVVWRGSQADEESVEIFDDLTPQIVNRAVAFVDHHHIEILGWEFEVVDNRQRLLASPRGFLRVRLVGALIQLLAFKRGIHALDCRNDDLGVAGHQG